MLESFVLPFHVSHIIVMAEFTKFIPIKIAKMLLQLWQLRLIEIFPLNFPNILPSEHVLQAFLSGWKKIRTGSDILAQNEPTSV